MCLCIFYMLKSTFSDPGVIPRGNLELPEEDSKEKVQVNIAKDQEPSEEVELQAKGKILSVENIQKQNNISIYDLLRNI